MRTFIMTITHAAILLAALWTALSGPVPASAAEEIDCLMCHGDLAGKKVKHAAVDMGCPGCHSAVDASDVPHKMKTRIPKGLSSTQPELCYGCHDRAAFSKRTVHAALGMGCTGCHNPHSSEGQKLLTAPVPDLCFNCHDKTEFNRKNTHPPVAAGQCLTCHSPHATDSMSLLVKEPLALCLECHDAVEKRPHAIKGFANAGHPLGKKAVKDPKRPDRAFYCGSCHDPHSSDSVRLFRYQARSTMGLCTNCHRY
jgi:predicted CXXCH cytochrome family protein